MDYQKILEEVYEEIRPMIGEGKVADYIPALSEVDPHQFGMSLTLFDGTQFNVGNSDTLFSIQSISKVFTFTMALETYGKELYERVGVEPSGDPFNSLVQLEYEKGKPRNPFINAGAINVADALLTHYGSSNLVYEKMLSFIKDITGEESINCNPHVYSSEVLNGYRNSALANLMKSFGNLDNKVEDVVNTYFRLCSLDMNTKMLSKAMLYLANNGIHPLSNKRYVSESRSKRVNAIMLTCGHYDASGEFAFNVGLPGKSGVGGGIVVVVPGLMGISVFSPGLNKQGNSLVGTKALELFTDKSGLSIF